MRRGNQEPTFKTRIAYAHTDGPEVVEWFESIGHAFYPCQAMEMDVFCARDEEGDFAYRTICISKPRQNGKSYSARNYAVEKSVVEGMKVCYSAHHSRTTHKMFKEVLAIFEADDELSGMLAEVSRARGFEGIWLTNGGCIEFYTRSTRSGGGRGTTYDIIVVDEAQEMTEDEQDALKPTQLASESGDPQMILIGTPPGPSCSGTVFRTLHDRAHSNPDTCGFAWMEWAVESLPDMDGDRTHVLELAYETNPAMGYRIRESVMLDVINTATSVDGFSREYLGWWSPVAVVTNKVFDMRAWNECATDDEPKGDVCYGVKLSPDGSEAALSACWRGDVPHFELVDYKDARNGFGWLADWLDARADKCAMLAVDGRNADALTSRLENYRARQLHVMRTSDAIAAAALIVDGVRSGTVTHYGQEELDEQARNAIRRPVGRDAWCIGGEQSTAIESAACALWAAKNAKWKPGRKARIG